MAQDVKAFEERPGEKDIWHELNTLAKELTNLGRPNEARAMLEAARTHAKANLFVHHSPRFPFCQRGLVGNAWLEDGGSCNSIAVLQCPDQPGYATPARA